MGSVQTTTQMKNMSILTLLLNKTSSVKRATITNIAESLNKSLQDSFSIGAGQTANYSISRMQQALSTTVSQGTASKSSSSSFKEALEAASASSSTSSSASASVEVEVNVPDGVDAERLNRNLGQASSLVSKLNITSNAWAVESLARDLAVFDLDMTVLGDLGKDPEGVLAMVREKSQAMLEGIDGRRDEYGFDHAAARNTVTGASARVMAALQGASGAASTAAVGHSTAGNVSVGGVQIDIGVVSAAVNVVVDPLVFDMNGDGFSFRGAEDGVDFDMDGDGASRRMGFISGDDAFLFIDSNGDGVVSDGRQLFGNQDGYANGFEKLRELDENGDGVIDESDSAYDQLRLWVERTEDGVCEEGETMSLREAGISSINLGYEDVRVDDGKGNLVSQVGSYTRDDGSTGAAVDVWFQALSHMP